MVVSSVEWRARIVAREEHLLAALEAAQLAADAAGAKVSTQLVAMCRSPVAPPPTSPLFDRYQVSVPVRCVVNHSASYARARGMSAACAARC
jgi:hypothetical protein